jgi:hypothetical protein
MLKIRTRFVVALITFLLGVAITTVFLFKVGDTSQQNDAPPMILEAQRPHIIVPDAVWEPLFFEFLDEHTKSVKLQSLRTVVLPEGDFEVRLWYNALPYFIDGVVLRRSSNQWSAVHLYGTYEQPNFQVGQKVLTAPKSGWESTWKELVGAGILSLPDASEVQCRSDALDGLSYVVEINVNKTYRTYSYSNPQLARCSEAKRMIEISEIIVSEFGLQDTRK